MLLADLKGSKELLADHDPEESRTLLNAVVERIMEAVRPYEGTISNPLGCGSTTKSHGAQRFPRER